MRDKHPFKIKLTCGLCGSTKVDWRSGTYVGWEDEWGYLDLYCRECKNSADEYSQDDIVQEY